MLDACTENYSTLLAAILHKSIGDKRIAFGDEYLAFKVTDIILHAVETHLGQINVCMYAYAAHRDKLAYLHGGLNVQLMRCVFEYVKNIFIICTLGSCSKSQRKFRLEICEHFLICIGRSVVCFVDDKVVKIVGFEAVKIECNALYASAEDISVRLLNRINISADIDGFPKLFECLCSLLYKLDGMGKKERSAAALLCIRHSGNSLACTCCVIEQSDSFMLCTHFFK